MVDIFESYNILSISSTVLTYEETACFTIVFTENNKNVHFNLETVWILTFLLLSSIKVLL